MVPETVSVCPGGTLLPLFVQVVVAVALTTIVTSWLPSPAMRSIFDKQALGHMASRCFDVPNEVIGSLIREP